MVAGALGMVSIERLERALATVAHCVNQDPLSIPTYERLEAALEEARQKANTRQRARAFLNQRATGLRSSKAFSSDAPLP